MALTTDLVIIVNGGTNDAKEFLFRGVNARPSKSMPTVSVSPPTATSANTLHFPFVGQQEQIDFDFVLVNDGVDVSNGTAASSITTVDAQIQYLNETIFGDSFSSSEFVTWYLVQSNLYSGTIEGVITDLRFDAPAGRPSIRHGSITFKRGRIGLT